MKKLLIAAILLATPAHASDIDNEAKALYELIPHTNLSPKHKRYFREVLRQLQNDRINWLIACKDTAGCQDLATLIAEARQQERCIAGTDPCE